MFQFIHCTVFGGGWLLPLNKEAEMSGTNFFGEPPLHLQPLVEEDRSEGWIIEPFEMKDVLITLLEKGFKIKAEPMIDYLTL